MRPSSAGSDRPSPARTSSPRGKPKHSPKLFTKIKVEMPLTAPGTLTPEQTADLVSFMLSFNKFPAGATPLASDAGALREIRMAEPGAPAASAAPGGGGGGLYADAQAKRAEAAYGSSCAPCHGPTLGGDVGPALAGSRFTARWKDKSIADLFEKIQTTMPASAPGSLTPEQTADLVALVLSTNHYPGGTSRTDRRRRAPEKDAARRSPAKIIGYPVFPVFDEALDSTGSGIGIGVDRCDGGGGQRSTAFQRPSAG